MLSGALPWEVIANFYQAHNFIVSVTIVVVLNVASNLLTELLPDIGTVDAWF